jgi:hypothetical protein
LTRPMRWQKCHGQAKCLVFATTYNRSVRREGNGSGLTNISIQRWSYSPLKFKLSMFLLLCPNSTNVCTSKLQKKMTRHLNF